MFKKIFKTAILGLLGISLVSLIGYGIVTNDAEAAIGGGGGTSGTGFVISEDGVNLFFIDPAMTLGNGTNEIANGQFTLLTIGTAIINGLTSGTLTVDIDSAEAGLFRKNGDAGDVLTINTISGNIIIGDGEGGVTVGTGNTLRSPDITTGGAGNIAGTDLAIKAGIGTGIGDVGIIDFQLPIVATTGDNIQTRASRLTLDMIATTDTLTMNGAQAIALTTSAGNLSLSAAGDVILPSTIRVADDIRFSLGNGKDIVLLHRTATLTANTVLANVIIGTPVVAAIPADTFIVSNITADGDIVFIAQTGGNSAEAIRVDGSTGFVGIGGVVPTSMFQVNGQIRATNFFISQGGGGANVLIERAENFSQGAGDGVQWQVKLTADDASSKDWAYFSIDKDQLWTSTASTKDASFTFHTVLDDVVVDALTITSAGGLQFGQAATISTLTGNLTIAPLEDFELVINASTTNPSAEWEGKQFNTTISETGSSNANGIFGTDQTFNIAAANDQNWTGTLTGHRIFANFLATGNAYTVSNFRGISINNAVNLGSATLTNQYGLRIEPLTSGTNNYGLYIEQPTGTEAHTIHTVGGISFFGGATNTTQGTDIASATNIVIPIDGDSFELTGTTKVDLISNLGWADGKIITLIANESVTIDHGTTTSTTNITILLEGAGDYAMTATDNLVLQLQSTTAAGQFWGEISRSVH